MKKLITAIATQTPSGIALPILCLTLLSLTACGGTSTPEGPIADAGTLGQSAPDAAPSPTASNPESSVENLKFKRDDGSEAFSLKFKSDGAKLVDSSDQEIARLNLDENQKVKIKTPDETVLGYVISQDGYWKVENAEQTQELFILRRQDDGDYKLEDGNDQELYRIKARDYGFEIETPDKQSLYKIKVKGEKTSLRNASDETVISTKSPMATIAMACFGLDGLSQEQQVALAFAVNLAGGPTAN